MSWDRARANTRIKRLIKSIPKTDVTVERFADHYFPRRQQERVVAKSKGESSGPLILKLPYRSAVLVDGVHVYANLVDFNDFLAENDVESEESHQRALQFLHLHYAACDALVNEFDLQRVDYHGSRLHALVLTPTGPENSGARAVRAVAFAEALERLIDVVNNQIGTGRFESRLRVGIDCGSSVGINSGRGIESEPLFLGDPANYAAKLADGDLPGLYVSDRLRQDLDQAPVGGLRQERQLALESSYRDQLYKSAQVDSETQRAGALLLSDSELRESMAPNARFQFRFHTPPLSSLQFRELMPSQTVRMPMAAVFADLDGFTKYVAQSIATGEVAEMVARLHVIRGELTHVLRDDFGGKKVRFIGDCLQGVLAVGTSHSVDEVETIDNAVRCAAAVRSSFELCDQSIGSSSLGLGIGIEFGEMPVTRLGNHGELSVRCATGRTAIVAEDEQGRCNGRETAIGVRAFGHGSVRVKAMFGGERKISNLLFEDTHDFLDDTPDLPPVVTRPIKKSNPPLRAHCKQ